MVGAVVVAPAGLGEDDRVSDLAGVPAGADEELVAQHDAAAHAGAEGEERHAVLREPGAQPLLPEGGDVGVVLHQDLASAEALTDPLGEALTHEVGHVGAREHRARGAVEQSRAPDADSLGGPARRLSTERSRTALAYALTLDAVGVCSASSAM